MMAVLLHSGDCSIALSVRATKRCSSSGSEFDGCASSKAAAFRNETDGRLLLASAVSKSVRSYWWLAWSLEPIMAAEDGARWCGLAVDL